MMKGSVTIDMACPTTVHETVCVGAEVTITPKVEVGSIQTFCVGDAFIGTCSGTPAPFCSFMVSQRICVQVPLTFHAEAEAVPTGIVCGTPETGACPGETSCTNTIGYYKNNPGLVYALIAEAGGSIILGSGTEGLSFTVTESNAIDVLSFNTPSPPAPVDVPFAAQYQVLYAQLLAADLNVLNSAGCTFVLDAITAANSFLASSPSGGMEGAPAVQEPLALFNEGSAPSCPGHCTA